MPCRPIHPLCTLLHTCCWRARAAARAPVSVSLALVPPRPPVRPPTLGVGGRTRFRRPPTSPAPRRARRWAARQHSSAVTRSAGASWQAAGPSDTQTAR
eukprot:scaffold12829_cov116-Isochrysis_galbana.AAC.5